MALPESLGATAASKALSNGVKRQLGQKPAQPKFSAAAAARLASKQPNSGATPNSLLDDRINSRLNSSTKRSL